MAGASLRKRLRQIAVNARAGTASLASLLPGSSLQFGPPRRHASSMEANGSASLTRHAIAPKRIVVRPFAIIADPPFSDTFLKEYHGIVKEIYAAELPGGRYWGRHFGYVIDRNDTLITDLSLTLDDGERHDGLKHFKLPPIQKLHGKVAIINSYFALNFHHWLLDTLPRFEFLRRAGHHWSEIDHFVLPRELYRWHFETFEQLGIPKEKIVPTSSDLHFEADLLLVPSHSTPAAMPQPYEYPPEAVQFTRSVFLENNPFLERETPKRILVSREKAQSRRLVQGELAMELLGPMGFQKVFLEDHSLLEQAAMFHKADCVVMPTGGNLANFAFCRPGTAAIELFSPSYTPGFTQAMLAETGIRYYALVAGKTAPVIEGGHGASEDIDFDPHRLAAIIREALA